MADLGQHVARPPVRLPAAQAGHDAEGAGVVAAHRDRHPGAVGRVPPGRQRGGEDLQGFQDLHLGRPVVPGTLQQHRQRRDVVGTEHDVDPGGPTLDLAAVLLRQTSADGDLHARPPGLLRGEHAEISVELVVGVLPDRAGVEHHDVGERIPVRRRLQTGLLQQPGEPLRIVHIHLAAVGADPVGPGGADGIARQEFRCSGHGDQPTAGEGMGRPLRVKPAVRGRRPTPRRSVPPTRTEVKSGLQIRVRRRCSGPCVPSSAAVSGAGPA